MDVIDKYIELYKDGFEEDVQEYVEYFFDNCYNPKNAMINKSQTSALHLRYKSLLYGGKAVVFPFFVGVSTMTVRRGSGEITELIRQAISRLKDEKVAFAGLYPFRHNYYTRHGFVTVDNCVNLINTLDFHTISMPLSQNLIDAHMNDYYNLYTDFCKAFDVCLLRSKDDMLLKFKGMLADDTEMIHYMRGDRMIAYCLYANGEFEDMASCEESMIEYSQQENSQCRVIDIKVALELYLYDCKDCALYLTIQDNVFGDSYWRLDIQKGKGEARQLNAPSADCTTLTVQQLTLLLLRGNNAEQYGLSHIFKIAKMFIVDKY